MILRVWRLFLCKRRVVVIWAWLTWERWPGLVNLRRADSLTPCLPASSTLVMRWVLFAEYKARLAATTAGWRTEGRRGYWRRSLAEAGRNESGQRPR